MQHPIVESAIRRRVVKVPPSESVILREAELGAEFNMSRTPMRQILQELQRDNLVLIRAGYGSTVPALPAEDREKALYLVRDLYWAAARFCEGARISDSSLAELRSLRIAWNSADEISDDFYIDTTMQVMEALITCIDETILRHSLRASSWRGVRWRLDDVRRAPGVERGRVKTSLDRIFAGAETGVLSTALLAVAGVGSDLAKAMRDVEQEFGTP